MKYTFPPEFDQLTPEQISQVDAWLDEFPYRIVHQKLQEAFGIKISDSKLCRYTQHMELAEDLSDPERTIGSKELYAFLNGDPVPYDQVTLYFIAQKLLEQVQKPGMTVSRLVALHRLATFKQRFEFDQRRLALNEAKLQHSLSVRAARADSPQVGVTPKSPPVPSSLKPSTLRPSIPASASPASRPCMPPFSPQEWNSLLATPQPPAPLLVDQPKYSPPVSAAERLLLSHTLYLPDTARHLCVPLATCVHPSASQFAHLLKALPSDAIPFPGLPFASFPLAA